MLSPLYFKTRYARIGIASFIILALGSIAVITFSRPIDLRQTKKDQTGQTGSRTTSGLPILSESMPPFMGISQWWNTPHNAPLSPDSLRGRVILVDFWTYSCINCIRTYPFLHALNEMYAPKGLTIVGVHTPEFAFEADPRNVERELQKNNISYPVALDAAYKTWNAYENNYWPAKYLFDAQGRLRFVHAGEGNEKEIENAVRSLLAENASTTLDGTLSNLPPTPTEDRTSETYFGLHRIAAFVDTPGKEDNIQSFDAHVPSPDQWSIEGRWIFHQETIEAISPNATFRFNVHGQKLHIVMESTTGEPRIARILLDGKPDHDIAITASTLYDIITLPDANPHTIEIQFPDAGVRMYAATFS